MRAMLGIMIVWRSSGLNFQEYLEDLEHDQARHQGIHSHGKGKTRYSQRVPPVRVNNLKNAL